MSLTESTASVQPNMDFQLSMFNLLLQSAMIILHIFHAAHDIFQNKLYSASAATARSVTPGLIASIAAFIPMFVIS